MYWDFWCGQVVIIHSHETLHVLTCPGSRVVAIHELPSTAEDLTDHQCQVQEAARMRLHLRIPVRQQLLAIIGEHRDQGDAFRSCAFERLGCQG